MVSTIERRTVSVSSDLDGRMKAAKGEVNWSAIACDAFERCLGELATKKEQKDMNDVIQRLRASQLESQNESFKEGFKEGEKWAMDDAKAIQLERLDKACGDDPDWHLREDISGYTTGELIYFTIENIDRGEFDRSESDCFWGDLPHDDTEFVRGFTDGAIKVWYEVKDQL